MSNLISVILPCFNGGDTLERAVKSVLAQTEKGFEFVIINDGSTDGTARIMDRAASRDRRIRALHRPHRGIVAALNAGISASTGDYIARMDADDVSMPERLELQKAFLDTRPDVGLVASQVRLNRRHKGNRGYAAYVNWTNTLLSHDEISLNQFVESPLAHPSVMFRRSCVHAHGGYRQGPFPEDYEMWLRWLGMGVRMEKLPEILLAWSDSPKRLSRTDSRYSVRAFFKCKMEHLSQWLLINNPHHPNIIVWGAGRVTRKRAEGLTPYGIKIAAYLDIDPKKIGKSIQGRRVNGSNDIPDIKDSFIVPFVGNRGARDLIRARLVDKGFTEGRDFICAA
jgi:glycosyltransferase involved in cell wall biosynthesis